MNPERPKTEALRVMYDKLRKRLTRLSMVQQELVHARDSLDRELSRFRAIEAYAEKAVAARDRQEFAAVTAESVVEAFEVECSALLEYDRSQSSLKVLAASGPESLKDAYPVGADWIEARSLSRWGKVEAFIEEPGPGNPWGALGLCRVIFCPYYDEAGQLRGVLLGGRSKGDETYCNPIEQDLVPSFVLFTNQMSMLLRNLESHERLERTVRERTAQLAAANAELTRTNEYLKRQVAERVRAEEALRDSEQQLTTLLSNLPGYAYRCRNDKNRTVEFISEGVSSVTGYRVEDYLVHRRIAYGEEVHPDDRERVWNEVQAALEKRERFELVYRILTKSNEEKWVWDRGQGMYLPGGRLLYVEGFVTDITERKQAEAALRESEGRYRTLVETSPDAVAVLDLDGNFIMVNRQTVALYGFRSSEEMLGQNAFTLLPPEDRPRADADLRRVVETGTLANVEYVLMRKDGSHFPADLRASLLLDAAGKPKGMVAVARDITARKRAEQEVRRLNEELEQRVIERTARLEAANRELEAFSYSVSHDLRAPLRAIDGFSEALRQDCADKLDARGKEYLQRVRAAAQRMGQLIDDLLNLSRLARAEITRQDVDLSALAEAIAEELRRTSPDRDVELVIAPGLVAKGDKALLRVVLQNLLGNAWKFTSKHERARVEFGVAQVSGERTYFVRDDGAGFDTAYADKLCAPFQRLHAAADFPGTGIGLAIVQRIVQRHGGRVWAEGAVGKGATFYFTVGQEVLRHEYAI
jgi:PAS domain S-box-containing protein